MCQRHLRRVVEARERIRAAGGELLVVLPIPPARAATWQRGHGADDVLVVGDADRAVYRGLGVGRGDARALLLDPASWREAAAEALRLRPAWKHPGDDGFQLGADLVLDREGRVALMHRARTAADRVPVDALIARLAELAR